MTATNFSRNCHTLACGCSLMDGRCERHGRMMSEIRDAWEHGSRATMNLLYGLSDGYGEQGYLPSQGYDWSGIRDSSTTAIEAMWKAVHA